MKRIFPKIVLAAFLFALPLAAAEQIIEPSPEGQVEFVSPSGNIGCIYTPEGGTSVYEPIGGGPELSCSRVEPSYVTVILGPAGPAQRIDDPGEQGCCSLAAKLAYGKDWTQGPFTCSSTQGGLTCNSGDGHGFSISRAKIAVN